MLVSNCSQSEFGISEPYPNLDAGAQKSQSAFESSSDSLDNLPEPTASILDTNNDGKVF